MGRRFLALGLLLLFVAPIAARATTARAQVAPPMNVPASLSAASAPAPRPAADALTLPLDKGLPVIVRTALSFTEIEGIDEQSGEFSGTVDLRLRWEDSRLRFPASEALGGFYDFRGELAEAKLAEIWAPDVALANLADAPKYQVRRLRIYPDGRVELMQRTTGTFTSAFDFNKFPFDRQELTVSLVERREPSHRVTLDYRQDDVEFSRIADGAGIDGWRAGLLHLRRDPQPAWYGESQAMLNASLEVTRDAAKTVSSVFLPLLASLLVPLLALWLQRVDSGEITIEAFELTNILIGGVFAVLALNFTISSSFPVLAAGDNTVTRLLGLNYVTLAVSLLINIVLFRFNLVGRLFGRHVLGQTFRYLTWSLPAVVIGCAAAIILLALA